jgi:hypothetical protein
MNAKASLFNQAKEVMVLIDKLDSLRATKAELEQELAKQRVAFDAVRALKREAKTKYREHLNTKK